MTHRFSESPRNDSQTRGTIPGKQDILDQQQQTKKYFRASADEWQGKAAGLSNGYSVVEGRHQAVLAVLKRLPAARRFLDVGCGTGQLVVAAARQGLYAVGIDFAPEMIEHCETNRRETNVQASFLLGSFFDMPDPDRHFDMVSAQGFIEYLSPDQMEEFFARSARMLGPAGALVVGSRNRLFNAVSLNAFTQLELDMSTLENLTRQGVALQESPSQAAAFAALREFEGIDPQPQRHPETEVKVDLRYQYTPAELTMRLRKHGFTPETLYPVHFHGLPVRVMADHPEVQSELAVLMGNVAQRDQRLVPFCSTFVLDVRLAR